MKFPASGGSDIELLSEGTYTAVCTVIADIGIQPSNNPQFPSRHKIWLQWEIIGEAIDINGESKPRVVSQDYTASMASKSNLRPMIEAWRGSAFKDDAEAEAYDVARLLGQPCLLTVKHNKTGKYANVGAVMGLPKSIPKPKGEIVPFLYDTEHDSTFEKLPKFVQAKVLAQLDPPAAPAAPPKPAPRTTDAEADRIAAQHDSDPDDELNF